jgi:hypothetical protein
MRLSGNNEFHEAYEWTGQCQCSAFMSDQRGVRETDECQVDIQKCVSVTEIRISTTFVQFIRSRKEEKVEGVWLTSNKYHPR